MENVVFLFVIVFSLFKGYVFSSLYIFYIKLEERDGERGRGCTAFFNIQFFFICLQFLLKGFVLLILSSLVNLQLRQPICMKKGDISSYEITCTTHRDRQLRSIDKKGAAMKYTLYFRFIFKLDLQGEFINESKAENFHLCFLQ